MTLCSLVALVQSCLGQLDGNGQLVEIPSPGSGPLFWRESRADVPTKRRRHDDQVTKVLS